jgi:SAM-dependent methyltransferase
MSQSVYVQFGCGPFSCAEGWLNFDSSPTLRVERVPFIGKVISSRVIGNPSLFSEDVKYGDIVRGLPLEDHSVDGCYASHVLEHLTLSDLRVSLRNTARILKERAIFRLVVPDLFSRAKTYVEASERGDQHASLEFLESTSLGLAEPPRGILQHLRFAFGGSRHLWMWDENSLKNELKMAGFLDIRTCDFGDCIDPMFAKVEDKKRFYQEGTGMKECCLEARAP